MRNGGMASLVLAGVLSGGMARAQSNIDASGGGNEGSGGNAGNAGSGGGGDMDDKKVVLGADAQILLPISSDFSNATGPMLGGLLRAGYRVSPPFELTARLGYLAGLSKSGNGGGSSSISGFPVWFGARYYFAEPPAGFYGAAELAVNAFNLNNGLGSTGYTREGFNLGAGYVISPDTPIDIRAQLSYVNLLGTQGNESAAFGVGLSIGYSFFL